MEPQANSWNDDRLDELGRSIDQGLKEVRQELSRCNNTIIVVGGTIVAAIIGSGILG